MQLTNLTAWCNQILSDRALNALTQSFQIYSTFAILDPTQPSPWVNPTHMDNSGRHTITTTMDGMLCLVCELMSAGVFAIFVTHSMSSLATVRSYSSTFQMPVLLSRVAINTTRTASPAVVQSLYKALSTSAAAASAPVPGNNAIIITIYSHQDIRIKSTNISISSADKIRQPRTPSLTNSKKGKGIPILDYRA